MPPNAVSLTGSWSVGLARQDSDFDIVVCAGPEEVGRLHAAIGRAMVEGCFKAPEGSKTWSVLKFGGKGAEDLVKEGRFAETFSVTHDGLVSKCSMIYIHPQHNEPYFDGPTEAGPLRSIIGTITDSSESHYKPGRYFLQTDSGEHVEVVCWNKWAGLLKDGDLVSIKAVPCRDSGKVLHVQMHPEEHGIELLGTR